MLTKHFIRLVPVPHTGVAPGAYIQPTNKFGLITSPQSFSLHYQYDIKQTGDENKGKYQLGDYYFIHFQILQTNIMGIAGDLGSEENYMHELTNLRRDR